MPPAQFRRKRVLREIARVICEQESAKPSTAVAQTGNTSTIGGTKPERLRRALAGDLDNIFYWHCARNAARRYSSVKALSEDVRRYLEGETVTAHPSSFSYLSTKFIRRHWVPVVAASAVILRLIGRTVTTYRQKLKADDEAAKAKAISDFLQHDLLAQSSVSIVASFRIVIPMQFVWHVSG